MTRHIAIYLRVSTKHQDTRSQEPDLERWLSAFGEGRPVQWYTDKASGRTMDRPGWKKLEADLSSGKVETVLVWRLDRLGRTASGLTALFERLAAAKVNLVSLRDGFDLSTPSGRMVANVLASIAQFETEVRSERVRAGQDAARKAGKSWGGSKPGRHGKVTPAQRELVVRLKAENCPVTTIAASVGLSRMTVYEILRGNQCPTSTDS